MLNPQNNQWLFIQKRSFLFEKAQKAAFERGHSLVIEESDFSKVNCRITIICSKGGTKSSNKLLRSYSQLTNEAAGCNACANKKYGTRFPLSPETLTKIEDTKRTSNGFGKPFLGKKGKVTLPLTKKKIRIE